MEFRFCFSDFPVAKIVYPAGSVAGTMFTRLFATGAYHYRGPVYGSHRYEYERSISTNTRVKHTHTWTVTYVPPSETVMINRGTFEIYCYSALAHERPEFFPPLITAPPPTHYNPDLTHPRPGLFSYYNSHAYPTRSGGTYLPTYDDLGESGSGKNNGRGSAAGRTWSAQVNRTMDGGMGWGWSDEMDGEGEVLFIVIYYASPADGVLTHSRDTV